MERVSVLDTRLLFHRHTDEMLTLFSTFSREQWDSPTCYPGRTVRDLAAHLVQTGISRLSLQRDKFPSGDPLPPADFEFILGIIQKNNESWLSAFSQVSPGVILSLLAVTERALADFLEKQELHDTAVFAVNWAGESVSENWFDIAREFTERWCHHQQIRDVAGASPLTERIYLAPVIDTFMRAAPYWYAPVHAEPGSRVVFRVSGESGGVWTLVNEESGWALFTGESPDIPAAEVCMSEETAWRFLSRTIGPAEAEPLLVFSGNMTLARQFLQVKAMMSAD